MRIISNECCIESDYLKIIVTCNIQNVRQITRNTLKKFSNGLVLLNKIKRSRIWNRWWSYVAIFSKIYTRIYVKYVLVFVSLYISRLLRFVFVVHLPFARPSHALRCLFIRSSLPLTSLIPLFFCLPVNQRSFLYASTSYRYNMLHIVSHFPNDILIYLSWHFTSAKIRSPLPCILKLIHLSFERLVANFSNDSDQLFFVFITLLRPYSWAAFAFDRSKSLRNGNGRNKHSLSLLATIFNLDKREDNGEGIEQEPKKETKLGSKEQERKKAFLLLMRLLKVHGSVFPVVRVERVPSKLAVTTGNPILNEALKREGQGNRVTRGCAKGLKSRETMKGKHEPTSTDTMWRGCIVTQEFSCTRHPSFCSSLHSCVKLFSTSYTVSSIFFSIPLLLLYHVIFWFNCQFHMFIIKRILLILSEIIKYHWN